ncbi:MAG TPA: hypothetical protein VMM36_05245 [Opitutaceae bacterium]|nr:hypothetical protein [Opitutaceae bacterium]
MKLPHLDSAVVPERKITHYLLNPAHPAGGSKARFFLRHGFATARWRQLADALLLHARENDVASSEETRHGTRYVIDGLLLAPDIARLNVRSAWFISPESQTPRFVTAHPLPKA